MQTLLDAVFRHVNVPMALVDEHRHILESNDKLQGLTGVEKDLLRGRPMDEFLKRDDWNASVMEDGPEEGREWSFTLKRADADPLPVRVEEIPISGAGNGQRLLFIFDCSEIEQLRADNLHMARLASLGKLLAGIIHEISNPLSIINGCVQLLNAKKLPPEIASDIERIYSEAMRTSDLVKRVLSFARKSETTREKCSIQDVIEETSVLKRYSLKNNNVQLHFIAGHAEPLHVFGYRNQLMQVLLNLVNNAEQAIADSAENGTIVLRVAKARGQAQITVSDTGPGIAPRDQSRIFDAFFTTKEKKRGTGMGLYICRNIIRKHGGELCLLESKPGETAFRIQLPLYAPDEAGEQAAGAAGST